jgi:uncharacterized membrane protein YvbJ
MALIECSECGISISDKAVNCVKCGAPITSENNSSGARLFTTQETAKKFKLHLIITAIMFWLGLALWMINVNNFENRSIVVVGQLMFYTGGFFYVVTRCRIWWNHG